MRTSEAPAARGVLLAVVLLGAYALPLYFPPSGSLPVEPGAGASLLERLFPGVPAWWIGARLLALGAAAVAVAWSAGKTRAAQVLRLPPRADAYTAVRPVFVRAALAVTALHALASPFAGWLSRPAQGLYVVALAVPALLLAAGTVRRPAPRPRRVGRGAIGLVAVLLAAWVAVTAATAWHSPRAADGVDLWQGFSDLDEMSDPARNLLTETNRVPGLTCQYMLFQGVSFLSPGELTYGWIQAGHIAWIAVAGAGVAAFAAQTLGAAASVVAAAAFLFSPFLLAVPYGSPPLFLGSLLTVGLLHLLLRLYRDRSSAALAGLGALGGLATKALPAAGVAAYVALLALLAMRRGPRVPRAVLAIAVLSCVAAVVPGLPGPSTLREMASDYATVQWRWVPLETMLLGQDATWAVQAVNAPSPPRGAAIPLGALLAPFAIPRTPVRFWGDTLFDPVGAALAACAIAVCIGVARASPAAASLLGLLLAALLPGFISSWDRPSPTRLFCTPVPVALLAGVGFEVLRRTLGLSLRAAAGTAAAMAVAGVLVFDAVNPGILPASSLGIIFRALRDGPPPQRAVILDHDERQVFGFLRVPLIAAHQPGGPVAVRYYAGPQSLNAADGKAPELLFWSKGLEQYRAVSLGVCARWPGAALYVLRDTSGLSLAFAARPAGPGWTPALPAAQWTVAGLRPDRC